MSVEIGWVLVFGFVGVGVVGGSPKGVWDVFCGSARVFVFVVGLDYVEDLLWVRCDLVCDWVPDGGKVGLIFGSRLKTGSLF